MEFAAKIREICWGRDVGKDLEREWNGFSWLGITSFI